MLSAAASGLRRHSLAVLGSRTALGQTWRGFATGSSHAEALESDEHFSRVMQDAKASQSAVVVKYTATWCGPCKMIAPLFSQLSAEHTDVRFYTVNIENEAVAATVSENGVVGVPNFQFFLGDERVASFKGAKKDQLLSWVQQLQEVQRELGQQRQQAAAAAAEGETFLPNPAGMLVGA